MYAAWYNENPDVITTLLEAGVDVNARYEDDTTLLMLAASYNKNPDFNTILLQAGADINARAEVGATPLICASMFSEVHYCLPVHCVNPHSLSCRFIKDLRHLPLFILLSQLV